MLSLSVKNLSPWLILKSFSIWLKGMAGKRFWHHKLGMWKSGISGPKKDPTVQAKNVEIEELTFKGLFHVEIEDPF